MGIRGVRHSAFACRAMIVRHTPHVPIGNTYTLLLRFLLILQPLLFFLLTLLLLSLVDLLLPLLFFLGFLLNLSSTSFCAFFSSRAFAVASFSKRWSSFSFWVNLRLFAGCCVLLEAGAACDERASLLGVFLAGDGVATERIDNGVEASDRIALTGVETGGSFSRGRFCRTGAGAGSSIMAARG
jgi:hypothetical protein